MSRSSIADALRKCGVDVEPRPIRSPILVGLQAISADLSRLRDTWRSLPPHVRESLERVVHLESNGEISLYRVRRESEGNSGEDA